MCIIKEFLKFVQTKKNQQQQEHKIRQQNTKKYE